MSDPPKNVHWALDVSVSDFGSSFDTTTSSCSSTSTFQYINSQLIAHGFIASPGISLNGISNEDMERVTKCILAMLSQRVSDMSRAEELSTKLRTLSYDHERLMGMHRSSTEKTLSAEREVNMYKSRLAAAGRSLQSSESSHKQTAAELQRTRTSLQALRATYATEIKKKEKEIERMVDKWTKVVDSQAKSSTFSPAMVIRGANADVVSGLELLGKGKGYLEVALECAESSRTELLDETTRLRRLILVSANRLQSMIHEIRTLTSTKSEEPPSFDHDTLFPLTPINAADDKILSLFASARDAVSVLSKHLSDSSSATQPTSSAPSSKAGSEECKRLQAVIEKLRSELDEAEKLHKTHETETCELLDQLAAQGTQRASIDDLVIASERDAERDRLARIKKELEDEREKFTQAAVKLGKEKSVFESERIKFLEERRSWQVQQILSEHPSTLTPDAPPPGVPPSPGLTAHLPVETKSPRKSPRKHKVAGKSGNSRKTRVSRRSSIFSIPPPTHVEPAYETEVIPIIDPASKQRTNDKSTALAKSILPTSFVLPPPSPRTSLPPPESLLEPLDDHPPDNHPNLAEDPSSSSSSSPTEPSPHAIPTIVEPVPAPSMPKLTLAPHTPPPLRRPFPMAKPLASHMTHAYSPVKPSPLSRILMLADSPEGVEPEAQAGLGIKPLSELRSDSVRPSGPLGLARAAAAAVGGMRDDNDHQDGDSDDSSPLRERMAERNVVVPPRKVKVERADAKKRSSTRERSSSRNGGGTGGGGGSKGGFKVRETEPSTTIAKSKTMGAGEKENREKSSRRGGGTSPTGGTMTAVGTAPSKSVPLGHPPLHPTSSSSAASKPTEMPVKSTTTKAPSTKLPVSKGGARRVPIGSAEAAPVLPGWRG